MKVKLLAPIGSSLAVIGFFSPWMSCGIVKFSGFDLATGEAADTFSAASGAASAQGDMLVWLVLIASIAILVLYFFFNKRRKLKKAMIPTIGAAVLGLAVLAAKYIDVENIKSEYANNLNPVNISSDSTVNEKAKSEGFGEMMSNSIRIEGGYWLTAFALVTSIAGAWNYKDEPIVLNAAALGTPLPDDGSKMNQDLGL